jgi:hypothetical protein
MYEPDFGEAMKKSKRPQRLWPLALFRLKISEIASPAKCRQMMRTG